VDISNVSIIENAEFPYKTSNEQFYYNFNPNRIPNVWWTNSMTSLSQSIDFRPISYVSALNYDLQSYNLSNLETTSPIGVNLTYEIKEKEPLLGPSTHDTSFSGDITNEKFKFFVVNWNDEKDEIKD